MLPDDFALSSRILLALALIVVLPFGFIYVFVGVVNHVLLPLFTSLGFGPYYGRVYVSPLLAAVVVFGGLLVQLVAGPSTVCSSIGARVVDRDEYPECHAAVMRLAQQADVEPPALAVVTTDAPNAAAVHGPTGATVVVTTGLLDRLDDRERDAVLAHELAHLSNRDATVMTIAWLLPTITYYVALGASYVLYGLFRALGTGGTASRDGRGMVQIILILTVTAIVTLAVSAMFWVASVLVHRVLSRYREYAADRGAVAITGDPGGLASALATLDSAMPDVPDHDLRRLDGGGEALYVIPLEGRAFTDAELLSTDIFPDTHPPTQDRIDRLRELAGEGG